MIKTFLTIIGAFVFVASCKNKEAEKPLSMDDIFAQSDKYKEGDTRTESVEKVVYFDSLSTVAQRISDTMHVDRKSIQIPDTLLLPDRFLHVKKDKWYGTVGSNEIFLSLWNYKDSLQAKNGFFNWLDCFGKNCCSLQLYEEKNAVKESFLLMTFEKRMIYLRSPKNIDAAASLEQIVRLFPKDKILYVVSQSIGRKTEWWEYTDKKWVVKKEKI